MNQSKLTDLIVENILSTGMSVKIQITDSISENLTNSDLESMTLIMFFHNLISKFYGLIQSTKA